MVGQVILFWEWDGKDSTVRLKRASILKSDTWVKILALIFELCD